KKTKATSNIQKKTLLQPSPWLRSTAAICLLISYCSGAKGSRLTELPRRRTRYSLPQCVQARYSVRGITVSRVPQAGQLMRIESTSMSLLYVTRDEGQGSRVKGQGSEDQKRKCQTSVSSWAERRIATRSGESELGRMVGQGRG